MRKLRESDVLLINKIVGGQPPINGQLRVADMAEVLDYASHFGFDVAGERRRLNAAFRLHRVTQIAPISIAEKQHMARLLDNVIPGSAFAAAEDAMIAALEAIYGVGGSDYDPSQAPPIDVPAEPC